MISLSVVFGAAVKIFSIAPRVAVSKSVPPALETGATFFGRPMPAIPFGIYGPFGASVGVPSGMVLCPLTAQPVGELASCTLNLLPTAPLTRISSISDSSIASRIISKISSFMLPTFCGVAGFLTTGSFLPSCFSTGPFPVRSFDEATFSV